MLFTLQISAKPCSLAFEFIPSLYEVTESCPPNFSSWSPKAFQATVHYTFLHSGLQLQRSDGEVGVPSGEMAAVWVLGGISAVLNERGHSYLWFANY